MYSYENHKELNDIKEIANIETVLEKIKIYTINDEIINPEAAKEEIAFCLHKSTIIGK